MEIQQEIRDEVLVLKPIGRLDSSNAPDLESIIGEHLDAGITRLVFDFSALHYTSSAGLRVVLIAGKRLRPIQGRLVLAGMREAVHEIFQMSGFLSLFDCAGDVEEALGKL